MIRLGQDSLPNIAETSRKLAEISGKYQHCFTRTHFAQDGQGRYTVIVSFFVAIMCSFANCFAERFASLNHFEWPMYTGKSFFSKVSVKLSVTVTIFVLIVLTLVTLFDTPIDI